MNSVLQRIAVYCSASDGVPEVYNTAAYRLGQLLAQEGVEVVYGDGRSTQTIVTSSMHERKAAITRMVDAMVALPGGIGTMEELFECLTWKQLGLHGKPVVIVNTNGYFDPVIAALDKMVAEHFMQPVHRNRMFTVVNSPDEVLTAVYAAAEWGEHMRQQARTV